MSTRTARLALAALGLLLALALAFPTQPAQGQGSTPQAYLPYVPTADSNVVIDGVIDSDEYPISFADTTTGMTFYLEHDRVNMKVGLASPGTGWVGFGYGSVGAGMDGSNLLIGYVDAEGAHLVDGHGVDHTFVADTEANGTDDTLSYAGGEGDQGTVLEFEFPLRTNDTHDTNLTLDGYAALIVSYHDTTDDYTQPHLAHSFIYRLFVAKEVIQISSLAFVPPPGEIQVGQPLPLTVRATADGDNLLSGQVLFYRTTSFGRLYLGSVQLFSGEATYYYIPDIGGEVTFQAELVGTPQYLASSTQTTLQVQGDGQAPIKFGANSDIGLAWRNPYVVLILMVVGGIWTVIVSTLRLLLLIQKDGKTPSPALSGGPEPGKGGEPS